MKIANISFSKTSWEKFIQKPKPEQLAYVTERLSPKDPKKAEKLLEYIPYGNISSGNEQEVTSDTATDTTGEPGNDNAEQRVAGGEKKRTKKG